MSLLDSKARLKSDLLAAWNNVNTPDQTADAVSMAMYNFAVSANVSTILSPGGMSPAPCSGALS